MPIETKQLHGQCKQFTLNVKHMNDRDPHQHIVVRLVSLLHITMFVTGKQCISILVKGDKSEYVLDQLQPSAIKTIAPLH